MTTLFHIALYVAAGIVALSALALTFAGFTALYFLYELFRPRSYD